MTWKLRMYKVKNKSTGEYERKRNNPIRETSWKHDRLKVPKLGEVKIYMHRPLQGDPTQVTLVKYVHCPEISHHRLPRTRVHHRQSIGNSVPLR